MTFSSSYFFFNHCGRLSDEMLILAQDFIGMSIHHGGYGSWQSSQVGRVCGKAVHMAAV